MTDVTADRSGGDVSIDGQDGEDVERRDRERDDDAESTRTRLRAAANVLGLLLLIAIVLPFVVYAVPQVVGANTGYVVLSGSMEPAISPGDVIIVDSVPPESIAVGDVITYNRDGESLATTHRVVEVVEQDSVLAFRTKGDANEDADPALVEASQVRGKVLSVGGFLVVIPYIGYVIQFTRTSLGFAALVAVPLALLVLSEVYDFVRSSRQEQNDDADKAVAESNADSVAAANEEPVREGSAPADAATENDPGITLTPMDLRFSSATLAVFTAYACWVVYATETVWSATVAATVGVTLLLVGGMYFFGGTDPTGGEAAAEGVPRPAAPEEGKNATTNGGILASVDRDPTVESTGPPPEQESSEPANNEDSDEGQ